jgi:hypothetical protein
MPIDLYVFDGSPPNRSVLLCIAALGLDVNKKPTNLMAGEQMKPEFVKVRSKISPCIRIYIYFLYKVDKVKKSIY